MSVSNSCRYPTAAGSGILSPIVSLTTLLLVLPALAGASAAPLVPLPGLGVPAPGPEIDLLAESPPQVPPARECAWTWPDGGLSGWYAGVGGGLAYTQSVDSNGGARLADLGFNNATVDFDASAWAGKLFVGYRFQRPFSVEAGWVDLGQVDGDFRVPPPPVGVGGSFRQDTSGFFASTAWHFEETELWSVSCKVGAFLWDTDITVSTPGLAPGQRSRTESGLNPFFGLTAARTLSERMGMRIEYDRFYLDSDPTDLLSLGLFVKF